MRTGDLFSRLSRPRRRASGGHAAQALARKLAWEPPDWLGLPGSIPEGAWDVWRRFEEIAGREIVWRPVDARARAEGVEADYDAESEGARLLMVQHDWHGFPDRPEFALYVVEGDPAQAVWLGCFDKWPDGWRAA